MSKSFINTQRRMSMVLLKAGQDKVWMNPEKMDVINTAKSYADIKRLIQSGDIKRKWGKRELHPAVYDKIYNRRKSWPNPYFIKMIPNHLQPPPPLVAKDEEQRARIEKEEHERLEKIRKIKEKIKADKKIMPEGENYITKLAKHPIYLKARLELAHRAALLEESVEGESYSSTENTSQETKQKQKQRKKEQQKSKPEQDNKQ